MPLKIGLFACELLYPDTPPHLGMCLFVNDLREAGVEVHPYLVNIAEADRISSIAREEGLDLVALESIFPCKHGLYITMSMGARLPDPLGRPARYVLSFFLPFGRVDDEKRFSAVEIRGASR